MEHDIFFDDSKKHFHEKSRIRPRVAGLSCFFLGLGVCCAIYELCVLPEYRAAKCGKLGQNLLASRNRRDLDDGEDERLTFCRSTLEKQRKKAADLASELEAMRKTSEAQAKSFKELNAGLTECISSKLKIEQTRASEAAKAAADAAAQAAAAAKNAQISKNNKELECELAKNKLENDMKALRDNQLKLAATVNECNVARSSELGKYKLGFESQTNEQQKITKALEACKQELKTAVQKATDKAEEALNAKNTQVKQAAECMSAKAKLEAEISNAKNNCKPVVVPAPVQKKPPPMTIHKTDTCSSEGQYVQTKIFVYKCTKKKGYVGYVKEEQGCAYLNKNLESTVVPVGSIGYQIGDKKHSGFRYKCIYGNNIFKTETVGCFAIKNGAVIDLNGGQKTSIADQGGTTEITCKKQNGKITLNYQYSNG